MQRALLHWVTKLKEKRRRGDGGGRIVKATGQMGIPASFIRTLFSDIQLFLAIPSTLVHTYYYIIII